MEKIIDMPRQVYISDASRPVRSRIKEHINKVEKISPDSFIVQHWCTAHGTALRPPDFKFKVESSHSDALSRQICEAVMIEETGILNSKSEFGMNHLCRMVTDSGPWKTDKALEAEVGG